MTAKTTEPPTPKLCQSCRVRMRVRTSRRLSPTVQEQRLECKRCGRKLVRRVDADEVWRRGQ